MTDRSWLHLLPGDGSRWGSELDLGRSCGGLPVSIPYLYPTWQEEIVELQSSAVRVRPSNAWEVKACCQRRATGAWIKRCDRSEWGGAKGRDRTADPSIFSAVLYRLSYLGVDS
jgi:hypothetical protein